MDLDDRISEFKNKIWEQLEDERKAKDDAAEVHLRH
jgi:hypothetical protein